MVDQWPEGRAADPDAARERYDADMRATRKALREVVRAEPSDAHFGLAIVVAAGVVLGFLAGPVAGAWVGGSWATLFLATLAVMFLRGARGRDAVRRAYLFTFGWAQWI